MKTSNEDRRKPAKGINLDVESHTELELVVSLSAIEALKRI